MISKISNFGDVIDQLCCLHVVFYRVERKGVERLRNGFFHTAVVWKMTEELVAKGSGEPYVILLHPWLIS